ncbi:hypothetical protein [Sphingobium sp. AP50]|uniref:hypothetical protein n=1 Tax=Sphingobium sp. AP50 TaxID=1884369 RepID=UPI0015A53FAD|nr:hypothetical protein [Sphingobium sp. AP50]
MNRDEGIIAIASAAYAKAVLELPDQVRFWDRALVADLDAAAFVEARCIEA